MQETNFWSRMSLGLVVTILTTWPILDPAAAEDAVSDETAPQDFENERAGRDGPGTEIVTVIGTRTPRAAFTTPLATSNVDDEQIELIQPYGFQDIFDTIPGVEIQGGARRIAEEPTIRGFNDQQVVTLLDGARQNFNLAHRGRFFVDPYFLKNIEVVRGSASALYGSGALGGVIALETKDPEDLLEPGQTFGGRIRLGYQTNGDELTTAAGAFGRAGNIDALANFVYRKVFNDLEDGAGAPILDSQDRVLNGLFKIGLEPAANQRLELIVNVNDNDGNNPTSANDVSSPTTVVARNTRQTGLNLNYNYDDPANGLINLRATGYYTKIEIEEDRFFDGRLDTSDFETLGLDIYNTSYILKGEDANVALTYGFEIYEDRQSGTRNGADRPQFPDATMMFTALYAQAEIELFGRLTIIPGLRWDNFDLNSRGAFPDRSENEVTPRVSVGLEVSDEIYLWGGYAEAFRAPSLTELFNDGTHFEVNLAPGQIVVNEFIPTPDLLPEKAKSWEFGARFRKDDVFTPGDRFQTSLTYYHSDVDNFVDTEVIFISGPPTFIPPFGPLVFPGTTTNLNVDATLKGFEGEIRYETDGYLLALAGHHVKGTRSDTGEGLGSIPQNRLSIVAEKRWLAKGVTAGTKVVLAEAQDNVPAGSVITDGYQTADLYVRWTPVSGMLEGASLGFSVDNLFDELYSIHPTVISQPGRSFRFSVAFQFGS